METQYQRGKIQDESMAYEVRKHEGTLPIVGVNTFVDPARAQNEEVDIPLARASTEEKDERLQATSAFRERHAQSSPGALEELSRVAREGGNVFEALLNACRVATLGQMTHALYEVGGRYRRAL